MIVSIDIGTSYSSISALGPDGKAHPVEIGTGASMFGSKFSLPSAVFVEESGEILVGQAAINQRKLAPARFRMEFKRNLGETVPIVLGSKSFLPEQLYTELLRHMKKEAEKTGDPITCAYLTFPAAYGKSKKEKLIQAARAAGLFDVHLVEEPTAAAMCYCAAGYVEDGQTILTYDFGGGTFDAALLRYEGGCFRLLTEPMGLENCGGVDMDRAIFQDMISKVSPEIMATLMKNPVNMMRFSSQLGELAVKAKHHLSFAELFQEYIPVGFDMIPYELSREAFNSMIASLVSDSVNICRKMVEQAGLKITDLSSVLMAGGTSRVPLVQNMVRNMAGTVPVYSAADLDLAVAQGALNYRMMEKKADAKRPQSQEPAGGQPEEKKTERSQVNTGAVQPPKQPRQQVQKPEESKTVLQNPTAAQLNAMMQEAEKWRSGPARAPQKALDIYERAAGYHYGPAQYMLGCICLEGTLIPADPKRGAELIRSAVNQGVREAVPVLAQCYEHGKGVERDLSQAISWYLNAVDGGAVQYETALAGCYHKRAARPEDLSEGIRRYYKAAQRNDTAAMLALARCYETGLGINRDPNQATAWYQAAADRGSAEAQYRLGLAYAAGSGVKQNISMGQYWMRKAADSGYMPAARQLEKLCNTPQPAAAQPVPQQNIAMQWSEKLEQAVREELMRQNLNPLDPVFQSSTGNQRAVFKIPDNEHVIITYDSTMLHTGQSGFVLTDMGIYSKTRFSAARFFGWLVFAELNVDIRYARPEIHLTDGRVLMECSGLDEIKMLKFVLNLQKRIKLLKDQYGHLL